MYVCPDCKTPLVALTCAECEIQFEMISGIPILLSREDRFQQALKIAAVYDKIYSERSHVWEDQGRTDDFLEFFSSLIARFPCQRYLEIGCGEGFLLEKVTATEKHAVDLSVAAARIAQDRVPTATCSLALAERLPLPAESFDLVASVGVMEHFLDEREALMEIKRVLRPGGHLLLLTHVHLTISERLVHKLTLYVFPRLRPIHLFRWLWGRIRSYEPSRDLPRQPIQRRFTTRQAKQSLTHVGLDVLEILHTRKSPELPLIGPWAVVYVVRK